MERTLFSNDVFKFVPNNAEEVMEYDMNMIFGYLNDKELTEVAGMLKMKNPETVGTGEIADAYYQADGELQRKIADTIQDTVKDAMLEDSDYIDMEIAFEHEALNDGLVEYGLLKKAEPYLIIGSHMGWRNLSGYTLTENVEIGEDILDSLHGSYDYTAEISREDDKPYLNATVWTHDAPTGESYVIIPMSWVEKALKSDIGDKIKKIALSDYDVFDALGESLGLEDDDEVEEVIKEE